MGNLQPSYGHTQEPQQRHCPFEGRQRAGAGPVSPLSSNALVVPAGNVILWFRERCNLVSSSQLTSFVTLAKILNLSEPQFSHLENEANSSVSVCGIV